MCKVFSTSQIAQLCHVTPKTVINWIDSGKLNCMKTAGGFRRVFHEDLCAFMKENNIPLEKLELRGKRILIIDDEPDDVDLMVSILESGNKGYIMEKAYAGDEGLLKTGVFKPDLIILDIIMPKEDGFRIAEIVKSTPETSDIKVLFITGYDEPETRKKIETCGYKQFLQKPLDKKKMLDIVNDILQKTLPDFLSYHK